MAETPAAVASFYTSALLGLRALEAAGARRPSFGADPDARWRAFKGELRDADRLDLLIRDAAKSLPAAFAPRVVLGIAGLHDDEPFGPDWPGPDAALAATLLRSAAQPFERPPLAELLARVVAAWSLAPAPVDRKRTADIAPQTRIVAAGAGAILALAEHFEQGKGLDLAAQVLLVTDSPGERQLLGVAAALLGSASAPRFLPPSSKPDDAGKSFPRADLLLVSDDADPGARSAAEAIARALGA